MNDNVAKKNASTKEIVSFKLKLIKEQDIWMKFKGTFKGEGFWGGLFV